MSIQTLTLIHHKAVFMTPYRVFKILIAIARSYWRTAFQVPLVKKLHLITFVNVGCDSTSQRRYSKVMRVLLSLAILVFFAGVHAVLAFTGSQNESAIRCGYIDNHGEFIIKPKFLSAQSFSDGIAWAQSEASAKLSPQRFDAIDSQGRVLFSVDAIAVEPFKDGVAKVIQTGMDEFVDHSGKFVTAPVAEEPKEDRIQPFGKAIVDGKNLTYQPNEGSLDHQRWGHFSEGLCHVSYNMPGAGKYDELHEGFMDSNQHIVLQLAKNIKDCGDFHEGFAPVMIELSDDAPNQKLGFINRAGEVVISPTYELPTGLYALDKLQFHDHVALVKRQEADCYINAEGKMIAQFQGGFCRNFSEGRAAVGVLLDAKGSQASTKR